jgi:hypothetical protein
LLQLPCQSDPWWLRCRVLNFGARLLFWCSVAQVPNWLARPTINVPMHAVHGFAQCTQNTKTHLRTPIAITSNSTNMNPISAVIEYIESRKPGENILYTQVASQYDVNCSTLSQRHQRVTEPRNVKDSKQQKLSPQQELELVQYIRGLTKRGLPPTREMIKNFSSFVAKTELSKSWVTCFINRHEIHFISKWTTTMDRTRHLADSEPKYRLYFELLH